MHNMTTIGCIESFPVKVMATFAGVDGLGIIQLTKEIKTTII